jgi:hypothetical protein
MGISKYAKIYATEEDGLADFRCDNILYEISTIEEYIPRHFLKCFS